MNHEASVRLLFLCTHNSARSQIAEALARHMGDGRVEAFSAGTHPSQVHPDALDLLEAHGIETKGLTSKSLESMRGDSFDYVITVCDNARDECPVFPAARIQLHWSFPDPTAHREASARTQAFASVYAEMKLRIADLLDEIRH